MAVFFGGTTQFVAGVFELLNRNTFGSTVHCSYGAFWLGYAMLMVPSLHTEQAYAGDTSAYRNAVGIFLLAWSLLTLIFFVAALRTNIALLAVLGLLMLAFLLLGVAQFISTTLPDSAVHVNRAGGAIAMFCAVAALYAGSSGIMTDETTWARLPLGIIDRSRAGVTGEEAEETAR